MLDHGMGLVAARLAAHMRKPALRTFGTLAKIEVEADGFVLGCSRVQPFKASGMGSRVSFCFLP